MFEGYTDLAKNVMFYAKREGKKRLQNYITTADILIGCTLAGASKDILEKLGIRSANDIQSIVSESELMHEFMYEHSVEIIGGSKRAMEVLEKAAAFSTQRGDGHIGTEHLLYALSESPPDSAAYQLFRKKGITSQQVKASIEEYLDNKQTLGEGADEDEPHQRIVTGKNEGYWKIPRGSCGLEDLLRASGYAVPTDDAYNENSDEDVRSVVGGIYKDNNLLGVFSPGNNQKVTLRYKSNDVDQLKRAIDLRELLEENHIPYEEPANKEAVVEEFGKFATQVNNLLSRLSRPSSA